MAQNAYQTELTNPSVVSDGSAVDSTGFAIRRLSPLPIDFATPAIDCGNAQKAMFGLVRPIAFLQYGFSV